MQGVRILQLDIGLLLAGSRERGAIETRVTEMVSELTASAGSIVLVIDEIHNLVGAGSVAHGGVVGAGLDLANLLKLALSGSMQCIGATTLDEHRSHFEKDPALNRRFQPVHVGEPNPDEALEVRSCSDLHAGPILLWPHCLAGSGRHGFYNPICLYPPASTMSSECVAPAAR
jgi:ATP-dependent Clp protease ATP-binding subunit ClpC